jgi:8-oxo-dGTP pyrophosphatase MutT (NUDIX family)
MSENPWKRTARRTVYDNKWITVYQDDVVRPDLKPGEYGVVHFKNRAIGVVAIDDRDRVLLIGQWRYPLHEYSWEICEGGGPLDEDPVEAARRELREESGCTARHYELLLRAHLSNSVTDEEALVYLATGIEHGEAEPEGTEQLEVKWIPFAEAMAMLARGEITDTMSVMGLQAIALRKQGMGA